MAKNLQKSAIPTHKKVGILRPDEFARHISMQLFEPAPALASLVAHYFVARVRLPASLEELTVSDVLVQPEVHLMLTGDNSYIIGPASIKRELVLRNQDVYAGVRFKVGGFYPFWAGRMADLTDTTVPATQAFADLDQASVGRLLAAQDDMTIANAIEKTLLAMSPSTDEMLTKVQAIATFIENHKDIHSVRAIAEAFGLSERTLQSMFAARVGVGIKWIIARNRLVKAVEFAHTQDRPSWTEISARLGYSTQSHFVNDFKKIVGMSPSQYVKTLGSAADTTSVF